MAHVKEKRKNEPPIHVFFLLQTTFTREMPLALHTVKANQVNERATQRRAQEDDVRSREMRMTMRLITAANFIHSNYFIIYF